MKLRVIVCASLAWISYALALYISLYDLQTAFIFCFVFRTFDFACMWYVPDYLYSLTLLLYFAVCGSLYLEMITPLLELARVEDHETFANWLEALCAVMIVSCVHLMSPIISGLRLEGVFSSVGILCVCVLNEGLVFGVVTALILCYLRNRMLRVALGNTSRLDVYWCRLLFGLPLIGTIYYDLYAHYLRYLAVGIFTVLVELNFFIFRQTRSLSTDNLLYLNNELFGQNEDISLRRKEDLSSHIRAYGVFPRILQTVILNSTLCRLVGIKGSRIDILQDYLYALISSQPLSRLNKANCYFLQNTLISHPNFPLLVLLYRYHHHYFRQWEQSHSPFLVRLRGVKAPADATEAEELALMRELLEKAEAKLMLLWLIGKNSVGRVGRLPGVLLQEIVQFC